VLPRQRRFLQIHLLRHVDRHGEQVGSLQIEQRLYQTVPLTDEEEHGNRRNRRTGQRQNDVPPHLQRVRTVDHGGFIEYLGDAEHELAQQEEQRCAACEVARNGDRVEGAYPTEIIEKHVLRHERGLYRQHQCPHHHGEDDVAPLPLQAAEG